jgi:hypothetical protein
MKTTLMKKKYLFVLGTALVLLTSCSTAHRYNCGSRRRCIQYNETVSNATDIPQLLNNAQ